MNNEYNNSIRVSRYTIFLKDGETPLIYNSLSNDFMVITNDLYEALTLGNIEEIKNTSPEVFNLLRARHIVATQREDDDEVVKMEIITNAKAFSTNNVTITLAPTIACNLNCSYCFESRASGHMISKQTCEDVLDFINSHKQSKSFSLTWFGGEPLIGIQQIKYFLELVKERTNNGECIPMVSHSMITNATLLKEEAIDLFSKFPLDSIQITLDGLRETHNKVKYYKDGKGTFDEIINNIEAFTKKCPQTQIALRVNIDNNNSKEYLPLYKYFNSNFKGKRIKLYPGILRKCRDNDGCSYMTAANIAEFNKWLRDNGIEYAIYPLHAGKLCCATSISAYAIGPKGEIYNCWEHMGQKDAIIGSIYSSHLYKPEMKANYIHYGIPFNNPKCRKCLLLPICSGGCPKHRVENALDNKSHDVCSIYAGDNHKALIETLLYYYHSKYRSNEQNNQHIIQ